MNTIKSNNLILGDIPGIHTKHKLLPFLIRIFLWLWSVIHYKKIPKWNDVMNHTMIRSSKGVRDTSEAVKRGYVIRNFMGHYADKLKYMVVYRLKDPLTPSEITRLKCKAKEMADKNIEYEVWNFLWWALYIVSNGNWDLSPKGSKIDDKVFCFEVSAMLIEAARPGTFKNPSHINTIDLMNDSRFEMLRFNF